MPFVDFDDREWERLFSRCALIGGPGAWKTSSLKSWLPAGPMAYVAYPGELGAGSLPKLDGVKAFVYRWEPNQPRGAGLLVNEVEQLAIDLISGKHGEFATLAFDGLHKMYQLVYDAELANLVSTYPNTDEDKLRLKTYGLAEKRLLKHVHLISQSKAPRVVWTMWTGLDKDNPDDDGKNPSKHVWPAFPGRFAQNCVGEFGCVLYSTPGMEVAPGKFTAGKWQTRRQGAVWGVGLKVPAHISAKVPTQVDQDWMALERLVLESK